ncbi:hypothetical protein NFI96_030395, partial [Prochilodus magdalenae]
QPAVIMKPTMRFLAAGSSEELEVKCNYKPKIHDPCDGRSSVHANSEVAAVIGKLLGFFLMPQVSYRATQWMSQRQNAVPVLCAYCGGSQCTVPRWQATAMVQLLKEFSWNWVAVIWH